jgi:hypothetical protein
MTKTDAIKIFGTRQKHLAEAVGRKKAAISRWPEELDEDRINLVIGAATRMGIKVPKEMLS